MADYLKIPELARRLDVSEKTARRYVKAGVLPSTFIGGAYRVTEKDLEEFLHGAEVKPESTYPKDRAPSSTQPPLNGFEEERRHSILAQAIATAAERWVPLASGAHADAQKAPGIVEAAEDLENLLSVVMGATEVWEALSSQERSEIASVAARLTAVTERHHEEQDTEQRQAMVHQWMRQLNRETA